MAETLTISEAISKIHPFGRFQIIYLGVLILQSHICGIITFQFQSLSIMPVVKCLSYRCDEAKKTLADDDLVCGLDRAEWEFLGSRRNWLTDFNLYCENLYLKGMGTSVYFTGFLASVGIFSFLCDRFGRRIVNLALLCAYFISLLTLRFATTLNQILVIRFILGMLHGGVSISLFVALSEFTLPKYSVIAKLLSTAAFSFGSASASMLALQFNNWHYSINILFMGELVVLGTFFLFCHETPFWLFAQGDKAGAMASINKVAKINNKALLSNVELIDNNGDGVNVASSESLSTLTKTPFLRRAIQNMAFIWFTVSVCSYALQFNAGSFGGNEYHIMIIMGMTDIPAKMLILYIARTRGRNYACRSFLVICGGGLILSTIPTSSVVSYTGMLTARATSGGIFGLLYCYTSEILPTLSRSTGTSVCSSCARVGALLSPFVILLNQVSPMLIYIIALVCILWSIVLIRSIPETLNKPLPNSVADCQDLFGLKRTFVKA